MNKRQNKLPPSPSSTTCRRPLLNITNLLNAPQSVSLKPQKQSLSVSESTKNAKPRISIDQFSRPKLKQVHSRKSNRSDSVSSVSSDTYNHGKYCKNHKNRIAMHQIQFETTQYFCSECSLVYAKQGHKIKPINSEKSNRQKQTNQYLQKCNGIRSDITNWRKQSSRAIKQIYEEFGESINNLKLKMEQEIANIRDKYLSLVKNLEQKRQQKIKKFKDVDSQIEEMGRSLESTRVDIQNNYEDCVGTKSFNSKQFRAIMDDYWKRVSAVQLFMRQNSIQKLVKSQEIDIKMTVRTMQKSDNVCSEFTFSKEKKFDTPPFSKQLRGIKIVESQPDSNRYNSSLKESVVDSKINFSQFNI